MNKFKKEAVCGIQSHNQRERKSKSNLDIKPERSALNYDLYNPRPINFTKAIGKRIDELNLKKSPRHDAVYLCGLIVSSDGEFFHKLSAEEQRRFFEASKDFLEKFVGRENVISATAHLDESTPHMHFMHVPVTPDGRLCAKDIYTRESLTWLHDELSKHLQKLGFDIERGVEGKRGSAKKHLNTREYKQQKEAEKLLKAQVEAASQEVEYLQTEMEAKQFELSEIERLASQADAELVEAPELPKPGLMNSKQIYNQAVQTIELQQKALTDKALIKAENEILKERQADLGRAIAEAVAEKEKEYLEREKESQLKEAQQLSRLNEMQAIIKRKDEQFQDYKKYSMHQLEDYSRLRALERKQIEEQKYKERQAELTRLQEEDERRSQLAKARAAAPVKQEEPKNLTPTGLSR